MATSALPIMSGSQLASSVPADLMSSFGGVSSASEEADSLAAGDSGGDDGDSPQEDLTEAPPIDEPGDGETGETDGDVADVVEDGKPAEPAAPGTEAPPAEDLPDGVVKTKNAAGKYQYRLEENRYKAIYGNHQLVQQAADTLGEPLTLQSLSDRNDAYIAQENLYSALESADPATQKEAFNFILRDLAEAHSNGEVGSDPTIPLAGTIYDSLRETAPDAFAALRSRSATDLMSEMFEKAAETGNKGLFSATQHVVAALLGFGPRAENVTPEQYVGQLRDAAQAAGMPFFVPTEMANLAKPIDAGEQLRRENQQLRDQLKGKTTPQVDPYINWHNNHVAEVNSSVGDEVKGSLSSVQQQWKAFPDDFRRLIMDPLTADVNKVVRNDEALDRQVRILQRRIQSAVTEEVRDGFGQQIKNLYTQRAKRALEQLTPPMVKFAADTLKGRSDTTHGRREGAQNRTAPQGSSAPARHTVLPTELGMKNGMFDPKVAFQQAVRAVR